MGRHMPPRVLALAAFGFILLILLLWPPRAGAGTYDVYSCRLPNGFPAPTKGWSALGNIQVDIDGVVVITDKCSEGGGLGFEAIGPVGPGSEFGSTFVAPADTTLAGFSLQ